jgi:hypothetical protein
MMIAAVPQVLTDAAAAVGAMTVVITGVALLCRQRPVRWLWHTLVAGPFERWTQHQIDHGTEQIRSELGEVRRVVLHHLGPNGTTPAITRRLGALEEANGLERRDPPGLLEGE